MPIESLEMQFSWLGVKLRVDFRFRSENPIEYKPLMLFRDVEIFL